MQEVAGSNPAGSTRRQNVAKVTLEGLPVRKVAVLRLKELGEGVWEEERCKSQLIRGQNLEKRRGDLPART